MILIVFVGVISGCTKTVHPVEQTKLYTLDDVRTALNQAGLSYNEKSLPPELKDDPDMLLNNKRPDTELVLRNEPIWVYIYSSDKEATKASHEFDKRFIRGKENIVHGITRNAVSAHNIVVVFTVYPPAVAASMVKQTIEQMSSK